MKIQFPKCPNIKDIPLKDWQHWGWQLRNAIQVEKDFSDYIDLIQSEVVALQKGQKIFNIRVTPYYMNLVENYENGPIRRMIVPQSAEFSGGLQEMLDPLGERQNNPTARIIHRYSDRLLLLLTDFCSVYCRYCTRKHFTGKESSFLKNNEYKDALDYIQSHVGIREVILSGGDPLTLSDSVLEGVLRDLRKIDHIEIIRIGSRMPVVCPMRITQELVQILRKFKPIYLMTHFNHPRELTLEAASALELLVDHGIPVFNQMVLLNGVNNHPAVVQALSRRLLYLRVKPYYMFQCDPSMGTDHLRTSIEDSLGIQRELWGHLSGLALPTLSVDIPDGGGKTTLVPNFEILKSQNIRTFKGWDGVTASYVSPNPNAIIKPKDIELYLGEWESLKGAKNLSPSELPTEN